MATGVDGEEIPSSGPGRSPLRPRVDPHAGRPATTVYELLTFGAPTRSLLAAVRGPVPNMHTIELDSEELRLLHEALHSYLDDFGHDQADVLRQIKALIAKLPHGLSSTRIAPCSSASCSGTSPTRRRRSRSCARYLRDESVDAAEVPGLRFKAWISDEATDRWGAVYLWETQEASEQELPSRARELIGKDPDIIEVFDVEATIEGRYADEELSRLGLAFE